MNDREAMWVEPPAWAKWLEEKDAEIASLRNALRDSQRALDEIHRQLQAIELCCDTAQDRVKELEAERDDYPKEHYDWCPKAIAQKALEKEEK